jgi:hypothetical protein
MTEDCITLLEASFTDPSQALKPEDQQYLVDIHRRLLNDATLNPLRLRIKLLLEKHGRAPVQQAKTPA